VASASLTPPSAGSYEVPEDGVIAPSAVGALGVIGHVVAARAIVGINSLRADDSPLDDLPSERATGLGGLGERERGLVIVVPADAGRAGTVLHALARLWAEGCRDRGVAGRGLERRTAAALGAGKGVDAGGRAGVSRWSGM
jgi:hypothetical protein